MSLSKARKARAAARLAHTLTYIGQDCDHAHGGMRYTSNGACMECGKATRRATYDTAAATAQKRAYRTRRKALLGAAALSDL